MQPHDRRVRRTVLNMSISHEPEDADSLIRFGMLSPVIDGWRDAYLDEYEPWFTFCRDLNQSVMKLFMDHWRDGEGGLSKAIDPTSARIFGRSMTAHVSAILLCERGLAIDAVGIARSISEGSFWLAYMTQEPDQALSDLDADDIKNQIAREKELQRVLANQPETIADSKARETVLETKLAERKPPAIGTIAKDYGLPNGYLNYRIMSGFYSHVSQPSLRHNFLLTGDKTGMNILGPHSTEIPAALYFAASSLIDCAGAYAAIVKDADAVTTFIEAQAALDKLRDKHMPKRGPEESD